MVKRLFLILAMGAAVSSASAQLQPANGDFETWTYDGVNLPNNWNSFQTASGTYASTAYSRLNRQVKRSPNKRPNSKGIYSCVIWCRNVVVANAQGNLTSGCVNAGAMVADNIANYNWTDRNGSNTNNSVVNPRAMAFSGRPDSIVVWVRFVPKKEIDEYNTAKFSAIVHDDFDYIAHGLDSNDDDENKSHVVAKAYAEIGYVKSGTNYVWQRLSLPFDYDGEGKYKGSEPKYIQLNASTNAYPGKGTAGDSLYIDDIECIYNAPMRITEAGWSTFMAPFAVDVPEGVTASTVENAESNGLLTLKPIEGTIPANTPVVLSGVETDRKVYGVSDDTKTNTVGLLTGVNEATTISEGYVLQNLDGRVGFYQVNGSITIPANRAYLNTTSNVKGFYFETATGIDRVESLEKKDEMYDLSGRRVKNATKGVYIVNGKKVLK